MFVAPSLLPTKFSTFINFDADLLYYFFFLRDCKILIMYVMAKYTSELFEL